MFHEENLIGVRCSDEILDAYVQSYVAAIGNDFILMDDNAQPHRVVLVEDYLESQGLEWPAQPSDRTCLRLQ